MSKSRTQVSISFCTYTKEFEYIRSCGPEDRDKISDDTAIATQYCRDDKDLDGYGKVVVPRRCYINDVNPDLVHPEPRIL